MLLITDSLVSLRLPLAALSVADPSFAALGLDIVVDRVAYVFPNGQIVRRHIGLLTERTDERGVDEFLAHRSIVAALATTWQLHSLSQQRVCERALERVGHLGHVELRSKGFAVASQSLESPTARSHQVECAIGVLHGHFASQVDSFERGDRFADALWDIGNTQLLGRVIGGVVSGGAIFFSMACLIAAPAYGNPAGADASAAGAAAKTSSSEATTRSAAEGRTRVLWGGGVLRGEREGEELVTRCRVEAGWALGVVCLMSCLRAHQE